ncbi:MAG: hypothetical protein A2860_03325 [Candidatus Levybacteria bacterium RIFCSPHIGHO2_01_FULL_37_33]|nr:MAG: hypothetical protein A2860_03325 [Candidatus Levybacteria bacterium RIFCSPHIGHO2_01_FULL_37_33]OGH17455.1 MAG: hypothetical protein A3C97_03340 [Candidatus Levybacteria bacterium RIFCSPHIGHO2_02_FULL_37_11]OGH29895.1 MAG: hypothetical protein A3F30_01760 [Candidatus Levybacteria bacterium RIFCSPHIGHO2_12_FULL_37_12]OGH33002.1 MAG: hypothetical protein A2953_01120 [Candidatus Levybacteria bacterium RIFCSPLOWO2_01_FULL_36_54]
MKDIYLEPFLNSWPTPFSIKDIRECFKIKKGLRQRRKAASISYPKTQASMGIFSLFRLGSNA